MVTSLAIIYLLVVPTNVGKFIALWLPLFSSVANQPSWDCFHSGHAAPGNLSLCSHPFPIWLKNKLFLILFEVGAVFCIMFFFLLHLFTYLVHDRESNCQGTQLLGVGSHLQAIGT